MRMLVLAVLLCFAFGKKKAQAEEQLAAAKTAYRQALSTTGDFDCVAPEFDDVLRQFDSVLSGTPAKSEAKGLAQDIREKRAAAQQHSRAVDRAAAAPIAPNVRSMRPASGRASGSVAAPGNKKFTPPPGDDTCKTVKTRLGELRTGRRKAGKPAMGTTSFLPDGEVGFAPGSEPTPEEDQLIRQLKACNGIPAEG